MKKSITNLIFICLGLLVMVGFFKKLFKSEESEKPKREILSKTKPTLHYLGRDYTTQWHFPDDDDHTKVRLILVENGSRGFKYVKINKVRDNEWLAATTDDGLNIKYWGVWVSSRDAGILSEEVLKVYETPKFPK